MCAFIRLRCILIMQLVGLELLLTTPTYNYCCAAESTPVLVEEPIRATTHGKECWVYSRMAKTGSSTLTAILHDWYKRKDIKNHAFPRTSWEEVRQLSKRLFRKDSTEVVAGAYAEALRTVGAGGKCKWFAIFRHPIPRLVSAFYYCKYEKPQDDPCGRGLIDVTTADLATFAEMWSNTAMRHFIAAFVPPDEVFLLRQQSSTPHGSPKINHCPCPENPPKPNISNYNFSSPRRCPSPQQVLASPPVQAVDSTFPVWYKLGVYANALSANDTAIGDGTPPSSVHDAGVYKFLGPAINLIENEYAAVGILEDFNRTLQLFNQALEMPGLDWVDSFNELGTVNKGPSKVKEELEETLRLAWEDPTIQKFIWLDMLLYGRALAVHNKQLIAYGLE